MARQISESDLAGGDAFTAGSGGDGGTSGGSTTTTTPTPTPTTEITTTPTTGTPSGGFCCGPSTNYVCGDGFEATIPCPAGLSPCSPMGSTCAPPVTPTPTPTEEVVVTKAVVYTTVACASPADPYTCSDVRFATVAGRTAEQYCASANLVLCQPKPTATLTVSPSSQAIYSDQKATLTVSSTSFWNIKSYDSRYITVNRDGNTNNILVTPVAEAAGQLYTIVVENNEGLTASASVSVLVRPPAAQAAVNSLTLSPKTADVDKGTTIQLTATLKDIGGNILTGRTITWTSSNSSAASVNSSGVVLAKDSNLTVDGKVTITATCEDKSDTAIITVTVASTVTPTPTITATPTVTPTVTPTPPPKTWKSCVDGTNNTGTPPTGYKEVPYLGQGGGMCWEPASEVGFTPGLQSISFSYQRSSANFPVPQNFKAQNPSYSLSYKVKLITNNTYFTVTPSEFTIPPRESKDFTVAINNQKINDFADGQTRFDLSVEITPL